MRTCIFFGIISAACLQVNAQYAHLVLPIGNFADVASVTTFAHEVNLMLASTSGNQTILFTGDIINKSRSFEASCARIDTFLRIVPPGPERKIIFIPGDRDWASSGQEGWELSNDLGKYLSHMDNEHLLWPLPNGCPGPERIELDLGLNLIVMNTQWWNHPYEKPTPESAMCEIATHDEAMEELEKLIGEAQYGNILIAGHYPLESSGRYGGHFPLSKWLFPVPIVSTMMTAKRQNVGNPYFISNARYEDYRDDVEDILSEYPSLIYVSGHDACREVLSFESENILIQSGVPDHAGYIRKNNKSRYASDGAGLILIYYDLDGNVWASPWDLMSAGYDEGERIKLLQAPCMTPMRDVPVNQRLVPCLVDRYVLPQMAGEYPGTTRIAAGPQYKAGALRELMLGAHYRDSWTTPVAVPYLNLDTYAGGLIPYLKGGGRQTKSLRMRAEDGREYVFRSVDKDPSRALSHDLRSTLISLVVRDQTTTQQPYGAMPVGRLMDETPILHATPELFVMPDDEKLGPFRETFGNMIGMIEERPSGRKEVQKTFADADELMSSSEMVRALIRTRRNQIDQEEFLEARVFDILVGDWSKHEDNWKWAGFDQDDALRFRPIPRDRDHVFSKWDGVLPWLVDREWAKPQGENFDFRIRGLRSLMWQARYLDRFLTNAATLDDWKQAARRVQADISDADIDTAMTVFPDTIQAIDGNEIAAKLKARRVDLEKYASQYYRMISKSVDISGSNHNETFDVTRNPDGTLDVTVTENDKHDTAVVYQRHFVPDETKEVRLYGLRGDDAFHISGASDKSILVRVVPGAGTNTILDDSSVRKGRKATRVYSDHTQTSVAAGQETKLVDIPYEDAYHFRRMTFEYNTYAPLVYLFSSSGNGIVFGGGVSFTNQSYEKPDYSSIHRLMIRVSTLGNLRFEYIGKLRHVVGMWDLVYGGFIDKHQRLNYFFGTGNETVLDPDLLATDYYTLKFSALQLSAGLTRTFWERSVVGGGLTLIGTGKESVDGNILDPGSFPDVAGTDRLRIAKLQAGCDFDFRDRPNLPQRGMRFTMLLNAGKALNDSNVNYSNGKATLEYFGTAKPFTLGLKVGGAVHSGVTPFFDLQYLGQNSHLRGFRQNRFTGSSLAFFNSDLRIHLVNNPKALIPYKLGITFFYDMGKVFEVAEGVEDPGWHMGYGAGVYFVPIRERFALQVSVGFSDEESGLVRFGLGQSF